jgi:hypothetical protein
VCLCPGGDSVSLSSRAPGYRRPVKLRFHSATFCSKSTGSFLPVYRMHDSECLSLAIKALWPLAEMLHPFPLDSQLPTGSCLSPAATLSPEASQSFRPILSVPWRIPGTIKTSGLHLCVCGSHPHSILVQPPSHSLCNPLL